MASDSRERGLAILLATEQSGGIERYCADLLRVTASSIAWHEVRVSRRDARGTTGLLLEAMCAVLTGRRTMPTIVFADRLHVLPVAIGVKMLARRPRPSIAVGVYGTELVAPSHRRVKRVTLQLVDRVVACSKWSATAANTSLGHHGPVAVVHPGVTTADWQRPADFSKVAVRRRWRLDASDYLLITVCRLDRNARHKGVDRVLRALLRLRAEGMAVSYVIVGGGDDEAWVDQQIIALGLESVVVRVGKVGDADLREILWASDVFALPTVAEVDGHDVHATEGFGIALVEANCAGLPVIATGEGGSAEAMQHGVSGLRVDGSVTSIVDAVRRLTTDVAAVTPDGPRQWAARFAWEHRTAAAVASLTGRAGHP